MNPREQRGLELAKAANIRHTDKAWYVPSQNGKGHHYSVNLDVSLETQYGATQGKAQKRSLLIYAGFASLCKPLQPLTDHS